MIFRGALGVARTPDTRFRKRAAGGESHARNRSGGGTARWALIALLVAVAALGAFQSRNRVSAMHGDTVGDMHQIAVVFVQPDGETLTDQEQTAGMLAVADATAFWGQRSLALARMSIASSAVMTSSESVYTDWMALLPANSAPLTSEVKIFLVDNSASRRWFAGPRPALALYSGIIWAVLYGLPGTDGLAAALAHELGHAVYQLDDLAADGSLDIMAWPIVSAYQAGAIGCRSLAALGAPCLTIYLPFAIADKMENH